MGILTEAMARLVREQRLGYVATVDADGTPNLSPKGTTTVWDDDHLVFADIRSPRTVGNLRRNPAVEVNVVDPIARRGYRFKGAGEVLDAGPRFAEAVAFFRRRGVTSPIRSVVLIRVTRALPVTSPLYDGGASEAEVRARWRAYWRDLEAGAGERPRASERARPGARGFTTIELKTNFVGTAREGTVVCEATLAHRGRSTQVWDARVTAEGTGKAIALFRCMQFILYP